MSDDDYSDDYAQDDYYYDDYYYQQESEVSMTIASLPLQKPPSTAVRRQGSLKSDDDIPLEFDKTWSRSDVVLRTLESEGKELHSNKALLSVFSPHFNALFSGRFADLDPDIFFFSGPAADKEINSVDMKCDYNAMKEILRNIHQVDCSYKSNGEKQYDASMLMKMYHIGDYYNFPHILKLCLDQMTERPSVQIATSAASLGLQDTLMDILQRLPALQVKQFLRLKEVTYVFTKKEVLTLYEHVDSHEKKFMESFSISFAASGGKLTPRPKKKTPKSAIVPPSLAPVKLPKIFLPEKPLNLEEINVELENPRIDLTKPWEMADVAIYTKKSMARVLYANKSVINVASTKFKNLSFTPLLLEETGCSISWTTVDAEYTTMKEILSVLHHCEPLHRLPRVLHPAILHSMYRVAAVDQLDIPMIREHCIVNLLKQPSVDSLEALLDFNISLINYELPISKWREWINRPDGYFSYRKGDSVVVLTPPQNEPRFTNTVVSWLIDQLAINTYGF